MAETDRMACMGKSRQDHRTDADVGFSHRYCTTHRKPSAFACRTGRVWGDDGRGALREKPELMSLDNHNKPDKDDSFMGVVHALKDLSFE